jgi:hypothetical protein
MTQLILNVNDADLSIIEPLLSRLRIVYAKKEEKVVPLKIENSKILAARKKLLAMVEDGLDTSYFGDPVEFQKEARKDKVLAFREE